jgi:hypothetical protein
MPCSPNTPVKWSDVSAIAVRIDTLAVTLQTPGYEPLDDVLDMPFKFRDLEPFAGAICFAVTPGTTTVIDQYLSDGVFSTTSYELDEVLVAMAAKDELFLVVEEDGCWCKTLLKVDDSFGNGVAKEADQVGCCQTLFIPQVDDLLNGGQYVIPYKKAARYASFGNPDEFQWASERACLDSVTEVGFRFSAPSPGFPLVNCTREVSGKFTWPIKAAYMDKMVEKMEYILACANSGGAKADSLRTSDPEEEHVPTGCEVTLCDLVRDRVERGVMDYQEKGCVSHGCINKTTSLPTKYPWNEVTCGGEECDEDNGPKTYCRTIEDLEAILDAAEGGLRVYDPPTSRCWSCACGIGMECEQAVGSAESCLVYASETGIAGPALVGWCIDGDLVVEEDEVMTFCNGEPLWGPGSPCGSGPGGPCVEEGPVFGTEGVDWARLMGEADAAFDGCPLVSGGCEAYASMGSGNYPDPVLGAPNAAAAKASLRVRFRVSGDWDCTGEQTSSRSVRYDRVVDINGEVTRTPGTATATWDAGEGTYVSPWIEEEPPAWPPAGPDSWSSVHYEVTMGRALCPEGCTPA